MRFSGGSGGAVAPLRGESRKLLEAARNCWNPVEPAGIVEDPPPRTLRCRPSHLAELAGLLTQPEVAACA
eukprot:2391953-Alexandrium_andersonii.AAC.1